MLIRQEMCEDGVQRLVCRTACTKLHTFQPRTLTSLTSARLFGDLVALGSKKGGSVVCNAIREEGQATHDVTRTAQSDQASV